MRDVNMNITLFGTYHFKGELVKCVVFALLLYIKKVTEHLSQSFKRRRYK